MIQKKWQYTVATSNSTLGVFMLLSAAPARRGNRSYLNDEW